MKYFARRVLKNAAILVLLVALLAAAALPAASASANVTKTFDSYTAGSGSFTLTTDARIFVVSNEEPTGMLRSTLQLASSRLAAQGVPSGKALDIVYGAESKIRTGDLVIRENTGLANEQFRLSVTAENATIEYTPGDVMSFYNGEGNYNSLLYGFHALLKLFNGNQVGACTVEDQPDTKERTVQLDIGRKYWSVEWIKNLIDEMSWMGYNAMDLHMTEDQGIRANIWRDSSGNVVLDANGNDFSWMIGYNVVSWNTTYTDPNANKFYNRDELTEIVNYAKSRHIEIIPAVDYPTHADCLIAKYASNYGSSNFTFYFNGQSYTKSGSLADGTTQTINIPDDYTRNMTFAITDAYAQFFAQFGCSKFNIGGDEVAGASSSWASSSFNKSNGGSNVKDAYVIYINQLAAMLQQNTYGSDNHSYRVRAWNDALFGNGFYLSGSWTPYGYDATVSVNKDIDVLFWTALSKHTSPNTLAGQGRKVYNCVNWYTYYVFRNNDTYGDARDDKNLQWTFNHGNAQFVYSGCSGGCVYGSSCQHKGGWYPGDFNGCTSDCYVSSQYRTDDQLGGGYFLLWGDWAGWDTEDNIWNRTDNYGLIDRMWSNAAKMWKWNMDSNLDYSSFKALTAQTGGIRFFPGFTSCTSSANVPTPGDVYLDEASSVQVKVMIGDEAKVLETIPLEGNVGDTFTVSIPLRNGYVYSHTEGATFTPSVFGANSGVVTGTIQKGYQSVVVWFENAPYLDTLALLLQNPVQNDNYANYAAYETALSEARSFYTRVSASPKTLTEQDEIDAVVVKLLEAQISLARQTETTTLRCQLDTKYVVAGKVAVLYAESTENVTGLTVTQNGQSARVLSIATREEDDGMKSWRINIMAPETAGSYTYTVTATTLNGTKTATVQVDVK